jgi:hypothetical protein
MIKKKFKNDEEHEENIQKELDFFGLKLIKIIGVFGALIGLGIIIAFWVWVFRWLYSK